MANIAKYNDDIFSKTVIAKIENDTITDIIWDPDERLKSWGSRKFIESLSYEARHIITNVFEWSAKGKLRI